MRPVLAPLVLSLVVATCATPTVYDTNDLLTWHIPKWYAEGRGNCQPTVELSNVFVRNAFPWFIAERPDTAHDNYFRNGAVWQAIRCGASDGKLLECLP